MNSRLLRHDASYLISATLLVVAAITATTGLISDLWDLNDFVYHKYLGYTLAVLALAHVYFHWGRLVAYARWRVRKGAGEQGSRGAGEQERHGDAETRRQGDSPHPRVSASPFHSMHYDFDISVMVSGFVHIGRAGATPSRLTRFRVCVFSLTRRLLHRRFL